MRYFLLMLTSLPLWANEIQCPTTFSGWQKLVDDYQNNLITITNDRYIIQRKRFSPPRTSTIKNFLGSFEKNEQNYNRITRDLLVGDYVLMFCFSALPDEGKLTEKVNRCFSNMIRTALHQIDKQDLAALKLMLNNKNSALKFAGLWSAISKSKSYKESGPDPKRTLEFTSTDEQYLKRNFQYIGVETIPPDLVSQDFLRDISVVEKQDKAIETLREKQKNKPKEQQWKILTFDSQHIGATEERDLMGRLLVMIPAKKCKKIPCEGVQYCDRYFQIPIADKKRKNIVSLYRTVEQLKIAKSLKDTKQVKELTKKIEVSPVPRLNKEPIVTSIEGSDQSLKESIKLKNKIKTGQLSVVVSCNQVDSKNTPTYIYDYWRIKEGSKHKVSTRLKQQGSLENCLNCHSNGFFPIRPNNEDQLSSLNLKALKEIRLSSEDYKKGEWLGFDDKGNKIVERDRSLYGPPLGPVNSDTRKKVLDLCASEKERELISEAMHCQGCHDGVERDIINFVNAKSLGGFAEKYVMGEVKGFEMPVYPPVHRSQRRTLWTCLILEYFGKRIPRDILKNLGYLGLKPNELPFKGQLSSAQVPKDCMGKNGDCQTTQFLSEVELNELKNRIKRIVSNLQD